MSPGKGGRQGRRKGPCAVGTGCFLYFPVTSRTTPLSLMLWERRGRKTETTSLFLPTIDCFLRRDETSQPEDEPHRNPVWLRLCIWERKRHPKLVSSFPTYSSFSSPIHLLPFPCPCYQVAFIATVPGLDFLIVFPRYKLHPSLRKGKNKLLWFGSAWKLTSAPCWWLLSSSSGTLASHSDPRSSILDAYCWVAAEYKTVQYVFILEGSGLFLYSLNQAVLVAVVVVIIIELSLFLSVNM